MFVHERPLVQPLRQHYALFTPETDTFPEQKDHMQVFCVVFDRY